MPLKQLFFAHSIKLTKKDLKKMYLNFMCSDAAENSAERQSATESYCLLKKLLKSVKTKNK